MSGTITLRQRSGPIITIIVWAFLAFLIADAVIRGAWDTVGRFAPGLVLIGWLICLLLWRPAVIVGHDSVIIREVLRTSVIPFPHIRDVRLGTVTAIVALDPHGTERTYRPWNAPGMPRRKTDSGLNGGVHPDSLNHHPSFELLQRWERAEAHRDSPSRSSASAAADAPATVTSWNFGALGVTFALVMLVIVGVL